MTLQETPARERQVKPRLVVVGRDLLNVISTGTLLQTGFPSVSLVHTDQPLERALQSDPAAVTVLVAPPDADLDRLTRTLGQNAAILVYLAQDTETAPFSALVPDRVFRPEEAVLLQATVACISTQLRLSERAE